MGPTGINCRYWQGDDGGPSRIFCMEPFDASEKDVSGHAFTRTGTVTMSWTEDADGARQVEFTSDDPETHAVLMDFLNVATRSADQAAATS